MKYISKSIFVTKELILALSYDLFIKKKVVRLSRNNILTWNTHSNMLTWNTHSNYVDLKYTQYYVDDLEYTFISYLPDRIKIR